jgi:diguanylate cyclase (GGDEF)-like protein/PAS domain S-box-containing protein
MSIVMKSIAMQSISLAQLLDSLYEGVYAVDKEQKVTFWNRGAEKITGFTPEEVALNQYCQNLLMHVDTEGNILCDQKCPVAATIRDGKVREAKFYFQHKDGFRIPVAARILPMFDERNDIVGAIEIFNDLSNRGLQEKELQELRDLAMIDGLTGVRNRRAGEVALRGKMLDFNKAGVPYGVLFFDIDHFKYVNDQYGHRVGDDVLRMVAMTLKNSVRPTDIVMRWGGEELVVVVSGDINEKNLRHIAEKLRMLISKCELESAGARIRVTVSVGATIGRREDTLESVVERSDMLMYQSKQAGRNKTTLG